MTAAARQQRFRQRRQSGKACLRVEVCEEALITALLASGRLTEGQALRRPLVELELAKLLDDWAARWLKNRNA
jgi:hypothetical protein